MNIQVVNIDMAPSLALLVLVAVLIGVGVYLMMERSLSRIIIGSALTTHGVNLALMIAGGRAGGPPILGLTNPEDMSDPLPQAMTLTAIVIGLALTAFMLSMVYRSWQLNNHDEVQDDVEDRRLLKDLLNDELAQRVDDDDGSSLQKDAESIRDETDQGDQRHLISDKNLVADSKLGPAEEAGKQESLLDKTDSETSSESVEPAEKYQSVVPEEIAADKISSAGQGGE